MIDAALPCPLAGPGGTSTQEARPAKVNLPVFCVFPAMGVILVRRLVCLLTVLSGVWVTSPARAADPPPFAWKDGDRAVLIGDALIEREQEQGMVETLITLAHLDKTVTFRNLGWSGDTVFGTARARFGTEADGFKHLVEHVLALKPTVLIVGYGMTDSFAGEAGLPRFKSGLNHLLDVLGETRARVMLLSPIAHEALGRPLPDPTRHNEVLRLYTAAIRAIAAERKAAFVDLFKPFLEFMTNRPGPEGGRPLTDDGIHLNQLGYATVAALIGTGRPGDSLSSPTLTKRVSEEIGLLARQNTVLGLGEPRREGRYRLMIDGRKAAEGEFSDCLTVVSKMTSHPQENWAEEVRQVIIAKNRLYFYRWRPQNETYLFGFRKHEQGNNAVEIPLFDPLVEEKEKEIARLKVPVKHVYELIRVEAAK
jgi:lysophospholipase L1-like esterase